MILPLFMHNIKKHWILLLIFFAVLTMYTTVMISMYNPDDIDSIMDLAAMMPEGLMQAMGFTHLVTDLNSFLASWLYGMLMLAFPMIYSIIIGHKLICKMVDNSSFTYLLTTPYSRVKIIVTQGLYALSSMLVLFILVFTVGYLTAEALFPGELDFHQYFRLNVTTMLVNMLILMVVFLASAIFNDAKYSLSFGSGIPVTFFLLNMLANTSSQAEILKKFTPYGYYNPIDIVKGTSTVALNLSFTLIILSLLTLSIFLFNKKRLPL